MHINTLLASIITGIVAFNEGIKRTQKARKFSGSALRPSYHDIIGYGVIGLATAKCSLQTANCKNCTFHVKSAKVENPVKLQDKTAKCSSDFFAEQIVWEPDFFALCVQLFAVQKTSNVFVFSLQTSCACALRVHSNWFQTG